MIQYFHRPFSDFYSFSEFFIRSEISSDDKISDGALPVVKSPYASILR